MVGSEKVPFPSKPSSTGENNENDSNQDKMMITKLQNNKKMVPKHFMSPTISAASKAATPRKKVLSERNDSSNDSDPEDNTRSYFDMKRSPNKNSSISPSNRSSSRIVVSSYDHHASEPADDDYVDDSSVKSYDPLRNYLSPRPKYLRFNPNRRHEIFNRLEKHDLDSSFDSKDVSDEVESASSVEETSPCSSPPKENVVKTKNEEVEITSDDDYEEEEEEELQEIGLCVKGVLKLLFTLVACFLSTSYICSMNSPSPSPAKSATWRNLTDSCPMIKKHTLELIGLEMQDKGGLELGDSYNKVDEVEVYDEENGETDESIEVEIIEDNVDTLERCDKEFAGIENVDGEDEIDEDAETEVVIADKIEYETEVVRAAEIEYETEIFEEMIAAKTDESMSLLGAAEVLEIPNQLEEFEISVKSIPEEKTPHEPTEDAVLQSQDTLTDDKADDVVVYDNEAEMEKMGWDISAIVGVFITSLILTLLGIVSHSKKARNASARKTEFVLKPHKFGAEKKVAPVLPSVQRKIEFSARPPPLTSHLKEEASKELDNRISAPTVELIGEIVVGQLSNLKISGKNNQMTESESQPVSPVTQPSAALEYSANNSPSFGSFTTERKIKKKEGRLSEAMLEETPVRRSTRLRNRAAAVSP